MDVKEFLSQVVQNWYESKRGNQDEAEPDEHEKKLIEEKMAMLNAGNRTEGR